MTRPKQVDERYAGRYTLGSSLGPHPLDPLRHAVDVAGPGVGLEFGVATGRSLRLISEWMPAIGFDSFQGLPEDWRPGFGRGRFACPAPQIPNARIVDGLFADTLPGFRFDAFDRIALVHVDCDLYSSTKTVLAHVMPHTHPGTVIVFDEWHSYLGCERHEQRAWREYVDTHPDLDWAVIGRGPEQWAIRLR